MLEAQREILNALIKKYGTSHPEVQKQSEIVDKLLDNAVWGGEKT